MIARRFCTVSDEDVRLPVPQAALILPVREASTSLRTLLPIGLYDAAKLRPPLLLRREADCEVYDGIDKEQLNLDGLPVLAEPRARSAAPPSDSRRTMVTDATSEVFAVVFGVTGRAELEPAMEMLSGLLRRHCAGEVSDATFV